MSKDNSLRFIPFTDESVHHGRLATVLIVCIILAVIIVGGAYVYLSSSQSTEIFSASVSLRDRVLNSISQVGAKPSEATITQVKKSISITSQVSSTTRVQVMKSINN